MERPSPPPMMPKRTSTTQKLNYTGTLLNEHDMLIGHHLLSQQKSGVELMQNCDLPPPLKVFSGSDKAVMSSLNRSYYGMGAAGREEESVEFEFDQGGMSGGRNEKLELLRALRLSQTRAREAEKRAAGLMKEREFMCNAFLEDSLRLLAYRQWVKLLEVQVLKLNSESEKQEERFWCGGYNKECGGGGGDGDGDGDDGGGVSWFVVLAFCLGIAGVGFAFGCGYLF